MKRFKRIMALIIAISLIVGTAQVQTASAAGGSIVVSTQSELNAALKSGKYSKITLRTDAAGTIKITAGDYGNVSLVVDAPNATIRNNATAKKVYILGAKKFAEYAAGNVISIRAEETKFVTAEGAEVKKLGVAKDDAKVIIENKGSIGKVNVTKSADINLKQNGTLDKIYLKAETELSVTGTSEQQTTVAVYEGAAGSSVESTIGVKAVAYADAEISLGEGAENSTIAVKGSNAEVAVENKTEAAIAITDSEKGVTSISAGEEAKVKGDEIITTEPETTPAPTGTPAPITTPVPTTTPAPTPTASVVDNSSNYTGGGSSSGSSDNSGSSGGSATVVTPTAEPEKEPEKETPEIGKVAHTWDEYVKAGGKDKKLEINDKAIEEGIRNYSGIVVDGDIMLSDVYELTCLYVYTYYDFDETSYTTTKYGAKDISVLSELVNLQELYVDNAGFTDITILKSLKELQILDISNAAIDDLTPLKELPYLRTLRLQGVNITDVSVIYDLKGLTDLYLDNTGFKDLGSLAVLPNLQYLSVANNGISDLSGLDQLEKLTGINVSNNTGIEDFSPIFKKDLFSLGVSNTRFSEYTKLGQFKNLQGLSASNNDLDDISWLKDLTGLRRLELGGNDEIMDFSPVSVLKELKFLKLNNCGISDLSFLKGLNNVRNLYLAYNNISDASMLSELEKLSFVDLMGNPGDVATSIETLRTKKILVNYPSPIQPSNPDMKRWADYIAEGGTDKEIIFADKNLQLMIEQAVEATGRKLKEDGAVWLSDVYELTRIRDIDDSVSSLEGLGNLVNLTWLNIRSYRITDISELSSLTNLTSLYIQNTGITDVSPLKNLKKLRFLDIHGSYNLTDISPLAGLTELTSLGIYSCEKIADIKPILGLNNLQILSMSRSGITSIDGIENFEKLTYLTIAENSISDLSPVFKLKNLTSLEFDATSESLADICNSFAGLTSLGLYGKGGEIDLKPISDLKELTRLTLTGYANPDVEFVGELTGLTSLSIGNNSLTDVGFVSKLTNLTYLNIYGNAVSSLSGMENLDKLETFMAFGNCITDLTPISKLTKLRSVSLNDNASLKSISVLKGMTGLSNLEIRNTEVSSSEIKELAEALPNLSIQANPKTSYTMTVDKNVRVDGNDEQYSFSFTYSIGTHENRIAEDSYLEFVVKPENDFRYIVEVSGEGAEYEQFTRNDYLVNRVDVATSPVTINVATYDGNTEAIAKNMEIDSKESILVKLDTLSKNASADIATGAAIAFTLKDNGITDHKWLREADESMDVSTYQWLNLVDLDKKLITLENLQTIIALLPKVTDVIIPSGVDTSDWNLVNGDSLAVNIRVYGIK